MTSQGGLAEFGCSLLQLCPQDFPFHILYISPCQSTGGYPLPGLSDSMDLNLLRHFLILATVFHSMSGTCHQYMVHRAVILIYTWSYFGHFTGNDGLIDSFPVRDWTATRNCGSYFLAMLLCRYVPNCG